MPSYFEHNFSSLNVLNNSLFKARLKHVSSDDKHILPSTNEKAFEVVDDQGQRVNFTFKTSLKIDDQIRLLMLLGFGDGSLVKSVLSYSHVEEVIVYESNLQVLKKLFDLYDYSSLLSDKRLYIISDDDQFGIQEQIKEFFYKDRSRVARIGRYTCFTTPGTNRIFDNDSKQKSFLDLFGKTAESFKSTLQPSSEDAYRGLLNTLRNAKKYFNQPHLSQFKGKFQNMPGVVVATGPSLSQSLDFLKAVSPYSVVCCCDSALRILDKQDIKADFVASLERDGAIKYLFEGVDTTESILVAPIVLAPESFAEFLGPKIQISRDVGFEDWMRAELSPEDEIFIGSSASHLAFVTLRELGCNPIYVVGQDCAYDPHSGASHDHNAQDHILEFGKKEKMERLYGEQFEVDGYDGCKRLTNSVWHEFGMVFQRLVHESPDVDVINVMPIQYGIKLNALKHLEPKDAELKMCGDELNKNQLIAEILHLSTIEQFSISHKHIQSICSGLTELGQKCLEIMQEISVFWALYDIKLTGHCHQQLYDDFFRKLEIYQQSILSMNDSFFEKKFLRLIIASHGYIGIRLEELNQSSALVDVVYDQRIRLVYEWYNMVHHWATRANYAIMSFVQESDNHT